MKTDTHPAYEQTKIQCSCGNVIKTRSTQKDLHVEVCSSCHPFFTGKQSFGSKAGRVEKFKKKYSKN